MRSCWIALGAPLGAPAGCDVGMGRGRETQERGDTYTQTADSRCCTAETKNIVKKLYFNLTKSEGVKGQPFVCPSFIVGYSSLSLYSLQKDNILTKIWNLVTRACPEIVVVSCLY